MPNKKPVDVQESQPYRYGPINTQLSALNRNRDLSGVRGYPSDSEYMKTVADSNLERDSEAMKVQANQAIRKLASQKAGTAEPSSYRTGGIVRKTGMAMVHEGELIVPKEEVNAEATRVIPADAGWLTCPENRGRYTGDNAAWRR